jgi:hypothetical protein
MTLPEYDPERLHDEAVMRRNAINEQWVGLGCPLLTSGSTGQLVEHPLVKMLREHDVLVQRLGEAVKKRHRGPQPAAVLGLGVSKSRSATLRLAKGERESA